MRIIIITLFFLHFCVALVSAQKNIPGAYGGDIRVRAPNGWIFESELERYDFANTNMKKVALIYWPDTVIGASKTGITIFENASKRAGISKYFINYADSLISARFQELKSVHFIKLEVAYPLLGPIFANSRYMAPIASSQEGKAFLDSLEMQGYDGLLLFKESDMMDLMFGSKSYIPSKGVYQYYNTKVVYHGMESVLLNTHSKKKVKRIGYLQISGDIFPIDNIRQFSDWSSLLEALKVRFQNNIEEFIRVHKLQ